MSSSSYDHDTTIADVQAAVDQLFDVVARADIAATMGMMADAPHADQGTLKTHQDLEAAYGVLYETLERVEFDRTSCDIHVVTPEFAYVIAAGSYTTVGKDGTRLSGPIAWTYLWTKGSDGWKLQHMHQSLQQPLPERVFQRATDSKPPAS
jgi:ketosteroid isomerase-like protein